MIFPRRQSGFDVAHGRQYGFSLIEMLVSVAVTMVIMVALASSMLIATRALPDSSSPANATITAAEVAEQIAAELQYAVSVNARSANMIEFTVADRDGSGLPETIRYEWSGTLGDPLTRQYNGGSIVEILPGIKEFNLSYDLETISDEIPQGNESAETLLASYYSSSDQAGREVKADRWRGQYFLPSLPGDAVSWKVTRVRFYAIADGYATGECRVQLQLPTSGGAPSGVVLEEKTLLESTLPYYYNMQEFTFSGVSGLSPEQGLCLVFKWISGTVACSILIRDEDAPPSSGDFMRSDNQGASWTTYSDESLLYWIYGTVTTVGEPLIEDTYHLQRVEIKLRTGDEPESAAYTHTRMLNAPEVTL